LDPLTRVFSYLEDGMDKLLKILAQFFIEEFDNDSAGVAEWLDKVGDFDTEEDRDEFIKRIRKEARR